MTVIGYYDPNLNTLRSWSIYDFVLHLALFSGYCQSSYQYLNLKLLGKRGLCKERTPVIGRRPFGILSLVWLVQPDTTLIIIC